MRGNEAGRNFALFDANEPGVEKQEGRRRLLHK